MSRALRYILVALPIAFTLFIAICSVDGYQQANAASAGYACYSNAPDLHLSNSGSKWDSYQAYLERNLSVSYTITNEGSSAAYNVKITASSGDHGVTLLTELPATAVDLNPGAEDLVSLTYHVPAGINSFRSANSATAQDDCGISHSYGTPLPGPGTYHLGAGSEPQINSAGEVVWVGPDWNIYLYVPESGTIQLGHGLNPRINDNGQVVWKADIAYRGDYQYDQWQIFLYTPGSGSIAISNIFSGSQGSSAHPEINANGQVVWTGNCACDPSSSLPNEVYSYAPDTGTTILGEGFDPSINRYGQVVWSDNWDIYLYSQGSTAVNLTPGGSGNNVQPQINDTAQVVWTSYEYDGWTPIQSIYLFTPGSGNQKVNDSSDLLNIAPQINASGYVVWFGYNSQGIETAFEYTPETGAFELGDGTNPQINSNNEVAWMGNDGLISLYAPGSPLTKMTESGVPNINSIGQLVWGTFGTNPQVLLYTP
jgi:hypothetical protein